MKKRISCLLLTVLTAVSSAPVYAGEPAPNNVSFTIGGMRTPAQDEIYNIDGKNYLPMRAMFELLGGEVDWNKYKNEAKVTLDDMRIIIQEDGRATINGEAKDLDVQRINGSIYLPVRLMGETLGFKVVWDPEERNIDIRKADSDYILLDLKANVNENTRILTFEEAKKLAENKSSTLKNIEDSVDYMKDSRDTLSQTITTLDRASGSLEMVLATIQDTEKALTVQTQLQESISGLISAARAMKRIDVQQSLTKVNEQMVRDGIEITLLSQINAIKGTEVAKQLLEQSIAINAEDLANTKLKNSLGYASDVDVKKAELAQEELEKNLELTNESLATQKEALNFTLGLDAKTDVYVESDKEVSDLSNFDLETFVVKQRESAPNIKVLDGNVTIAEYANRTTDALVTESRKGVQNDLNSAERSLKDGKDTLEKNIRSAYHQLQQLALKDKQLKLDVETAIINYNSAVVSYNAGMATEFTVKQARLGVLNAEKAVEDNKRSYIMLSATFEKPYLIQ
ncbi:MAG: hypothetical protein J6A07_03315 [Firmicutes bacterium]|nr:hypothetical protein [Bacillota bacterium]